MTPDSSALKVRQQALARLSTEKFDLCVIGGGITGAGIARDAVLRGLKVALIEKGDFASGTSSQSSKLLHGGVRYLEQFAFGLVRESIRERDRLATNAAHLCRPLPFIYPIFNRDRFGPRLINLGMWLYSGFAGFRADRRHRMLAPAQIHELEPGMRVDGLRGATLYKDCLTDDGRLTLETALDAAARGAVILSRVKALSMSREGDAVTGLRVRDLLSSENDKELEVRATTTILAAGPWTDQVLNSFGFESSHLLRPTKGVHIVVDRPRLPLAHAVVMRSPDDGRVLFAIPWRERSIVGTTDTDDDHGADHCQASGADVDYLLRAANATFPNANLERGDVFSTWAGLRPLLRSDDTSPSGASREHEIRKLAPGLWTIFGGKLTTYREMAEQAVDRMALSRKPTKTYDTPLPGSTSPQLQRDADAFAAALSQRHKLSLELARHLAMTYGDRAESLIALDQELGLNFERMVPDLPNIFSEISFAARHEWALSLEDALRRRSLISLKDRDQGLKILERAADILAAELNWSEAERSAQIQSYRDFVESTRAWQKDPISAPKARELVQK